MLLVVVVTLGKSLIQTHLYYLFAIFGFNISTSLSLLIYNKSLTYLSVGCTKYSTSQIINFSQVDTQRMTALGPQLVSFIFSPIQLIIGMIIVYSNVGFNFLLGILMIILLGYLTPKFAKKISIENKKTLVLKDERTSKTQEIL